MLPKKMSQEPIVFLSKKMWQFAEGHRRWVVLFLAMSAVANIILLTQPLLFGKFLNEIQRNGLGEHNIVYLVIILFAILAVDLGFWMFHGPSRVIENVMAFRTRLNYRTFLLSGVLGLGLSWHALRDSGDTIDKINKASEGLYDFSRSAFLVIEVFVKALGTTAILLFFNMYIGLVALGLLVVALIIIFQFDIRLIPQYKNLNIFENKISARIFDALSNITTVKVLNIEKPILGGIEKTMWAPHILFRKNRVLAETKWFVGSVLFTSIIILPLTVYILFLVKNNLAVEVGTIGALYLYLTRLIDVYFTFTGSYEGRIINRTQVLNVSDIEDAFSALKRARKKPTPHWQTIQLQHVSFKYEGSEREAHDIQDMSFAFSRGEKIALIGESGSGKTTFLKVIHGMYPETEAKIVFDKKEPQQTNFANIDLKTTLVPQEPEIFSASIRENITLGLEYTKKEIYDAIKWAEFTSVVEQLPNDIHSVINEKGVNLSGGQKQRLALARALLLSDDKEIMLLDESTSSVDPETEVSIYKNIFARYKGKTVIASIHKMNLLKYFDRIVMFANGIIVDQGTFDELLARNEKFQRDWNEYVAQNNATA